MTANLTLKNGIIEILKNNQDKQFTASELAREFYDKHTQWCNNKIKNSKALVIKINDAESVKNQIAREIGSQTKFLPEAIKITSERPRKYYYSDDELINKNPPNHKTQIETSTSNKLTEAQLYDKLRIYLSSMRNGIGCYSKRIEEKTSKNNKGPNGNKWLHPDIVAMEDISKEWNSAVKDVARKNFDKLVKIWSFEVKLSLKMYDVREAYFQTVSNSSWANFGYLVTGEYPEAKVLEEIEILSGIHGIGLIVLNTDDPSQSEIKIYAREKSEIDWNTANRLAKQNTDFVEFLSSVYNFYNGSKGLEKSWDEVPVNSGIFAAS